MPPRRACLLALSLFLVLPQSAPAEPPRTDLMGDPLPDGALVRLGTTRLKQERYTGLAWAPSGKLLAACSAGDHPVLLWDAATGKELRHFGAGLAPFWAVAFSPDSTVLAAAGHFWEVHLWDVATGKELRRLKGHEQNVSSLVFAPDGRSLFTASYDRTVRQWDVATGRELRVFKGHTDTVSTLALSPDGKTLASGGEDRVLRLWDVASGRQRAKAEGHDSEIRSVAFAPDGKKLASVSWDGSLRLWDSAGNELLKLHGDEGVLSCVAFSRDGGTVITGGNGGTLRWYDPATDKVRHQAQQRGRILALAVAPDGRSVATAGDLPTIRFWDMASAQAVGPMPNLQGPVKSLGFAADGKTVWTTDPDHTMCTWDPATGRQRGALAGPPKVRESAVSADGRVLAFLLENDDFLVWDAAGKLLQRIRHPRPVEEEDVKGQQAPAGVFRLVGLSPDGSLLAAVANDGTIHTWQTATGRPLPVSAPSAETVSALAFSADGRTLATAHAEVRTVLLWETATGKPRLRLQGIKLNRGRATFSPDGQMLAIEGKEPTLQLWEPDTSRPREVRSWPLNREPLHAVAFAPDGARLAAGVGNAVLVWDVRSGEEVARFEGHRGPVKGLAFAPDGRTLASGSEDTTALIWALPAPPGAAEAAPPPTIVDAGAEELEELWSDLAGADGVRAYRAIRRLTALPEQSTALFRERLRPVLLEPGRVERLIADLDSNLFAVRHKATGELEELGLLAETSLRQARDSQPSPEMGRRLDHLLARLRGMRLTPDQLRSWRALETLERIGTPEALAVLAKLGEGTPLAPLTQAAKASLGRCRH